jgi:hypothetical protein
MEGDRIRPLTLLKVSDIHFEKFTVSISVIRQHDSSLYLGYQTPIEMAVVFSKGNIRLRCVHQCQDTRSNDCVIISTGGISLSYHHDTQILHTAFYNFPTLCHYY